ncbi:Thiosulfate sulfurtransferase GlpE [Planctomycetes bacterium Poly30]|uniref:Thiosulfate sulfurtransferase GlpE n=1 Tax=Saltatorellus ferox TaxID=2528018 RepID=A0A518EZ47_9BACT|nr:Thiosulfate sulfurtransferase GlpE [Planctomycetes bacterium Poly30]
MFAQYASTAAVLLVAFVAYMRATAALRAAEDAARDATRSANGVREELEQRIDTLQRLLARLAAGQTLTSEMINDGQLWKDVHGDEAHRIVMEASGKACVIDVRTPQETAGGIVDGALLIPMDEIPDRAAEIPNDGRPVLIYCAAGGRSAAVCDHLAKQGYETLHNLVGGFSAWPGPTGRPS